MINKDNYEDYFLLYADNELSGEERIEVEVFVKLFPELEEELNMIKLTITSPDENVSFDKSFLLKDEVSAFINLNNYEEIFVLYHDNELDESKRSLTERFVNLHPECKEEFELFGQAKFDSESSVVFPNKELLYRKETSAKVVSIKMWRMLAAAVLIGFGVWVALPFISPNKQVPEVALNGNQVKTEVLKSGIDTVEKVKNEPVQIADIAPRESSTKEVKVRAGASEKPTLKNDLAVSHVKKNSKPRLVEKQIEPNYLEEKIRNLKANDNAELVAVNNPDTKSPGKESVQIQNIVEPKEPHIDQVDPGIQTTHSAQETAYADFTNERNTDRNYVFYNVSTDEFKKSKVGGFLKMVKRMVERTNPIAQMFSGNDNQVASK